MEGSVELNINNNIGTIEFYHPQSNSLPSNILEKLAKTIEECGNNEFCWLKQNYMEINSNKEKFLSKFRPEYPNTWKEQPNKWLNTYNLLNVMTQYEDKYNNFKLYNDHYRVLYIIYIIILLKDLIL